MIPEGRRGGKAADSILGMFGSCCRPTSRVRPLRTRLFFGRGLGEEGCRAQNALGESSVYRCRSVRAVESSASDSASSSIDRGQPLRKECCRLSVTCNVERALTIEATGRFVNRPVADGDVEDVENVEETV